MGSAPGAWPLAVGVLPAAVVVVVVPGLDDPFLVPKAVLAVGGALLLAAAWAARVWRDGRIEAAPAGSARSWPALAPVAVYAAALIAATLAHERPLLAVAGHAGRHVGVAVGLAAVVVLLAGVAAGKRAPLAAVVPSLVAVVPVAGYALVQAVGADPLAWALVEGGPPVFSTLGNANFLSGWLGVVAPLGAWAAFAAPSRLWRAAATAVSGLALMTAALSGSLQGLGAGLVATGVVVVAGAWVRRGPRKAAAALAVGLGLASIVAAVAVVSGLAGRIASSARASLDRRVELWEVAVGLAGEHPWRGVGFGGYRGRFPAYQSAEAAAARGLERVADSPHSVPLELLVSGGWPLLLAWVAVVGAVVVALVRAWRGGDAGARLAAAGLGAAGAAYLAQASVSIDVAPLALTGGLLAGLAIGHGLAASGRPARRPRVDGGTAVAPSVARTAGRPPRRRGLVRVGAALVLLACGAGLVAVTLPLRADAAAAAATRAGDEAARLGHLERAAALAPWEPAYASALGSERVAAGDREGGLAAYEEAARRDPRAIAPQLNIGRLATALGDPARADAAYERAVELYPRTPAVLAEAGSHALERGRSAAALALLERALAGDDTEARWWRDLAEAFEAIGDDTAASAARAEARSRERRVGSRG